MDALGTTLRYHIFALLVLLGVDVKVRGNQAIMRGTSALGVFGCMPLFDKSPEGICLSAYLHGFIGNYFTLPESLYANLR